MRGTLTGWALFLERPLDQIDYTRGFQDLDPAYPGVVDDASSFTKEYPFCGVSQK